MNESKSMLITIGITLFLFSFIIFLVYLVYCFSYYDEYQMSIYTDKFNLNDSKYIYDNMFNDSDLTYDDFSVSYNLMYDKNNLKNIYYLYYKNSGYYSNLEEFIKMYYYGEYKVSTNNIEYQEYGKTNLFRRKSIDYKLVSVSSIDGYKSSLGLLHNIIIKVEDNSEVVIDDKSINCVDNECLIDNIFGGLHIVKYKSNNIDYYGIVNLVKDKQEIDITNIDSLVKIEKDVIIELDFDEPVINANLNVGNYKLYECYLDDGCPSKTKSYVNLYEDGTVDYYTYITLDIAGDTYHGTYEISGNFLILKFASHIYRVHDYDTKEYTDIEARVDMEMRFKIDDENTIRNDSYKFKYST